MAIQFSSQLTKLRESNNLSQSQLAEQLNVFRQAVSKWENGTALPDIVRLVEIAQLLNVSLDKLVLAKEPITSQSSINKMIDAHLKENSRQNSWRRQPITNVWEFLARYWWVIIALVVTIASMFGINSNLF